MTPQSDDATLAVVVARLDDLRSDVQALRTELAAHRADMVSRGEWEQRNRHVDARHQELGREIGSLRTSHATDLAAVRSEHATDVTALRQEIASRRMPWPAVASAIAGVAALAITLIQIIP